MRRAPETSGALFLFILSGAVFCNEAADGTAEPGGAGQAAFSYDGSAETLSGVLRMPKAVGGAAPAPAMKGHTERSADKGGIL